MCSQQPNAQALCNIQVKQVFRPNNVQEGLGNEGSSRPFNLRNPWFAAIEEEADVEGNSDLEQSDLNRVVSDILKNRKNELGDDIHKKRRQRLSHEQQVVLELEF